MIVFLLTTAALALPTPAAAAAAALANSSPERFTGKLLAQVDSQHSKKAQEEALEEDMRAARERLHRQRGGAEKSQESGSTAAEMGSEGNVYTFDEEPRGRRRSQAGRRHKPTIDGKGKAHYLVWGIIDWSIAGGLWTASLYSFAAAGVATALAVKGGRVNDVDMAEFGKIAAIGYGVVGLITGAIGGWLAYKGAVNVGQYRELRQEEQAMLNRDPARGR